MSQNNGPSFAQIRRSERLARRKILFGLPKDPRGAHGGATDHHAGNAGLVPSFGYIGGSGQIAVSYNGDWNRSGRLCNYIPISCAGIALFAGASVNGDG